MKCFMGLVMVGLMASSALATDLNIAVRDLNGNSTITVSPGATVQYRVSGQLTDTANEGLALIGFDLDFDGGPLPQANTPTQNPMLNFVRNAGITNPDGYGGTIINGDLIQIGGGQNTIKNFSGNADFPVGTVITGVAHANQEFVTGSFTAPMAAGTYTLMIRNVFANVIKQGQTGNPFWATEAAGVGNVSNLTVIVQGGGGCDGNESFKGGTCKCPSKQKMVVKGGATSGQNVQVSGNNGLPTKNVTANNRNKWKAVYKGGEVTCGTTYNVTATFQCGLQQSKTVVCN